MISLLVRLRQKSLKSFLGGSRVSIMLLEFPLWTVSFIASFFSLIFLQISEINLSLVGPHEKKKYFYSDGNKDIISE